MNDIEKMKDFKLTDQQRLLAEKLNNADQEIDQILPPKSLAHKFQRSAYKQLTGDAARFLENSRHPMLTIITGLRGSGKSTLLAQLYKHPDLKYANRLYLSLDQMQVRGLGMIDLQAALEHKLGQLLHKLNKPTFIFLDEAHALSHWIIVAKVLYDRHSRLFLVLTSSSNLDIWLNADVARRAKCVKMESLSLSEANGMKAVCGGNRSNLAAKSKSILDTDLSTKIKIALFYSKNAGQAYKNLNMLQSEVDDYWRSEAASKYIDDYITGYETSPLALNLKLAGGSHISNTERDNLIRVGIRQVLENAYNYDLPLVGKFDSSTHQHFPKLLLWLANSEQQSLTKMSQHLNLNIRTLQKMLKILVDSEILTAVMPIGLTLKVSKPYKYLFTSPAVRQALNNWATTATLTGNQLNQLRESLLEDTVGFYLKQTFSNQPLGGSVEYDPSRQGADFIVMPNYMQKDAITVEVGWQKQTAKQSLNTLKHVQSKRYGVVITDCELKLDISKKAIFVPLKVFLLMQTERF